VKAILVLLALFVALPARADDDDSPGYHRRDPLVGGVEYVGRVGAAFPAAGEVGAGIALADLVSPQFSLEFAMLARPNRWLRVGGVVGASVGVPEGYFSQSCDTSYCEVSRFRLGVEVQARLSNRQSWTPWVGAGMGLSLTLLDETSARSGVDHYLSYSSANLLRVMVGLDGHLGTALDMGIGIGPYLAAGVERTFDSSESVGQVSYERPLGDPGTNLWLEAGIQVTFGK
jgi:hypothetical protein